MSSELTAIGNNLIKKDQLSVDNLDIIGIVLEKTERCSFGDDEVKNLLNNHEFIKQIISD